MALPIQALNLHAQLPIANGITSNFRVLGAHFRYSKPPPALSFGKAIVMCSLNSCALQSTSVIVIFFSPSPANVSSFFSKALEGVFSWSVLARHTNFWVQLLVHFGRLDFPLQIQQIVFRVPKLCRCSAAMELFLASLRRLVVFSYLLKIFLHLPVAT